MRKKVVSMNLSWLISGKLVNENGVWTSDMASNRYRVLMPANKLAEQGHTINIIHDCTNIIASGGSELSDVDILIIAKSFDQDHLTVAKQAKSLGKKIIIDVCDNYFFQNAEMLAHYSALIELSNVVVANSQGMADSLAQRFKNKKIIVIEDPYESIKQPAVFSPSDKELRLAWFGYDRNLPVLLDEIPNLGKVSESIPIKLKIVTNKNDSLAKDVAAFNQEFAGQFNIEYILWSREATQQAILDSDIVLIPNKTVDDGLVKSSNRIIESIMMGRFVCASPIPSYKEFEQWAYVGDNLVEGIVWALNNPHEVTEKISQAQTYIESHYSPACIGDKWNQLLQEMTSAAQAVYTTSADDYVKLNLGCGDKILPGYVNVDVVPARAGNQPDVICDLHDLSVFENNSADEILSVHVI
ncbi:MAG: hypothetical protein R3240_06785 [Gammaproteobacteria bacterium]|nr:hypothetical protein [Gammaproteobacteria bacterium]